MDKQQLNERLCHWRNSLDTIPFEQVIEWVYRTEVEVKQPWWRRWWS